MPNQLTTDNRQLSTGKDGQAIVISILLVGVLLSIVLVLSLIFTPKIRASSEMKKSSAALYAAESAVEWCLYTIRHGGSVAPPSMSNSSSYFNGFTNQPFNPVTDCSSSTTAIKSVGTFQGISRSFEIGF
jgi:hypothetical protein